MSTALIKFTQGPNTDAFGNAVIGTLFSVDGSVAVTNTVDVTIVSWEIILLDAPPLSVNYPPASNPQQLNAAVSATPNASFDTDVPGTYRVMTDVVDISGVRNRDIRCFGVPDERGYIEPPYQKNPDPLPIALPLVITPIAGPAIKPDEQNYGGQERGWTGERTGDGQESTFRQNYKDVLAAVVTSTPFSQTSASIELYLINTTTIGVASAFNVDNTARVNQVVEVRDSQSDAFTNPITVTLTGGDTFQDGTTTRVIFADGGSLKIMQIAEGLWRVIKNTNKEDYIALFTGQESTSNTAGWDVLVSKQFNPTNFPPGARFVLEVMMETTNAANAHSVRLRNITLASTVSTPLSSTSLIAEQQADILLVPSDLPVSDNIYELQHQMAAGVGPDAVTCSGAHLRVVYAATG